MKKSIGFFLSIASAVIALVSIFLYGNVFAQADNTRTCLIVSVIVAAIAIGMSFTSMKELPNLVGGIFAVLLIVAACFSIGPMVTPIAYYYSGLYDFSTISGYVTFCAAWAAAWVLALVSSFIGLTKKS